MKKIILLAVLIFNRAVFSMEKISFPAPSRPHPIVHLLKDSITLTDCDDREIASLVSTEAMSFLTARVAFGSESLQALRKLYNILVALDSTETRDKLKKFLENSDGQSDNDLAQFLTKVPNLKREILLAFLNEQW